MLSLAKRIAKPWVLRRAHRRNERLRAHLDASGLAPTLASWGLAVAPNGDVCAGGVPLAEIAERFGTPTQVVDAARLASNFRAFRDAFVAQHPRAEIGFSYKTNPLPAALRILHAAGAVAEVISPFELWLALQLGMSGERIVFNGPAKTDAGLRLAVERRVRMINLDSVTEADAVQRHASEFGVRQPVGLRIVTSVGWAAQFGVPLAGGAAEAAFDRIAKLDRLVPRGLHIHLGTGMKNVGIYTQAIDEALAFAERLRQTRGIMLDFFDFGGGFGVPTVAPLSAMDERLLAAGYPSAPLDPDATPPLATYARAIAERFERCFGPTRETWPTLFLEPGRAVASSGQLLLLRVLALKPGANGVVQVILDGGHNLAIPTSYEHHHVAPVRRANAPADQVHDFFGPLCHPGDVVARHRRLPRLEVGDVVAILDAGAYFIPNQMNFSNPRAAAVVVESGQVRLARRRETYEDMTSLDVPGATDA